MFQHSEMQHYVYPMLDVECLCEVCSKWRAARQAFDDVKSLTLAHNRSCDCWRCKRRRELQQGFLAASSQRELYCEFSYHASHHNGTYGPALMRWVKSEISSEGRSNGWWATFGQSYPLSYWLSRFQRDVMRQVKKKARRFLAEDLPLIYEPSYVPPAVICSGYAASGIFVSGVAA